MKKILLGTFILLFSHIAFAKWYMVEMIVFEHLATDTGGEFWNFGVAPDYRHATELITSLNDSSAFKQLPPSRYNLGNVSKMLALSSKYHPVYQVAWQQPGLTKTEAKAVHIKNVKAKINGSVNLKGGHLLYLDLDISYFLDLHTGTAASLMQENLSIVSAKEIEIGEDIIMRDSYARMKKTRRIKLNELHYFDHPLFGVIMRVTRLEIE